MAGGSAASIANRARSSGRERSHEAPWLRLEIELIEVPPIKKTGGMADLLAQETGEAASALPRTVARASAVRLCHASTPSLKATIPNTHMPRSLGMSPLMLATAKKTLTIMPTPAIAGEALFTPFQNSATQLARSGTM